MKKLSPQQNLIIEALSNGEWHCLMSEMYLKDDRARISELRKKGYVIEDEWCDNRCGTQHLSKPKMRKLTGLPPPKPHEIFLALKMSERASVPTPPHAI